MLTTHKGKTIMTLLGIVTMVATFTAGYKFGASTRRVWLVDKDYVTLTNLQLFGDMKITSPHAAVISCYVEGNLNMEKSTVSVQGAEK